MVDPKYINFTKSLEVYKNYINYKDCDNDIKDNIDICFSKIKNLVDCQTELNKLVEENIDAENLTFAKKLWIYKKGIEDKQSVKKCLDQIQKIINRKKEIDTQMQIKLNEDDIHLIKNSYLYDHSIHFDKKSIPDYILKFQDELVNLKKKLR